MATKKKKGKGKAISWDALQMMGGKRGGYVDPSALPSAPTGLDNRSMRGGGRGGGRGGYGNRGDRGGGGYERDRPTSRADESSSWRSSGGGGGGGGGRSSGFGGGGFGSRREGNRGDRGDRDYGGGRDEQDAQPERELGRSLFGTKKASAPPPRRNTGGYNMNSRSSRRDNDDDDGGFSRANFGSQKQPAAAPQRRNDFGGPRREPRQQQEDEREPPSRDLFGSRTQPARETRSSGSGFNGNRSGFGRQRQASPGRPEREAPNRSEFGRSRQQDNRNDFGRSRQQDGRQNSGFGRRSRNQTEDNSEPITRESFGTKTGTLNGAVDRPVERSGFGRSSGSGFGRSGFGRSIQPEMREPERREPVVVAVPSASGDNPWTSRPKPERKPVNNPLPVQSAAATSGASGSGFGRSKPSSKPSSKPNPFGPSPSRPRNPFGPSSGGFGADSNAFGGSSNPFSGSGAGFGSDLLSKVEYGGLGTDHGKPRLTFGKAAPRKVSDRFSRDNLKDTKRKAKPSPVKEKKEKAAVSKPKISSEQPMEDFPTLVKKAPTAVKKSIAPKIQSKLEAQAIFQQQQEEKRLALEKERLERLAKKQKKEKLKQQLMNALNPNHGQYRSVVPKEVLVPSLLLQLDLVDEQRLNDLCRVLSVSIVSESLTYMTLMKRLQRIPADRMDGEIKEAILIGTLQDMHKSLGEQKLFKLVIKDDLEPILEALDAPLEGNPRPYLESLGVGFLTPKVNVEEKLVAAFDANASPTKILEILNLCESTIAEDICYIVLKYIIYSFFEKKEKGCESFMQEKTKELLALISKSMESVNPLLNETVQGWFDNGKVTDLLQVVEMLIAQEIVTLQETIDWNDSRIPKQYKKAKQSSLFELGEWFSDRQREIHRRDEQEYESSSEEQPQDDYFAGIMPSEKAPKEDEDDGPKQDEEYDFLA